MTIRIFSTDSLEPGALDVLNDEHHYLSRVRRAAPGDEVIVLGPAGLMGHARVVEIGKRASRVEVQRIETRPPCPLTLTMACAVMKGERMDWLISKLVELGTHSIVPLETQHSVVKLKADKRDARRRRYLEQVRAACRQSVQPWSPQIVAPAPLTDLWNSVEDCELKLIPCMKSGAPALPSLLPPHCRSAAVLIGPEGGFSATEIHDAEARGFLAVHLGPRILRAETAGLFVASALMARYGELSLFAAPE